MVRNWKSSSTLALTALVAVTAIWGITFLVVQNAIASIPVMDFLAWRFSLAALVMLALRPTCLRTLSRKGIWRGILLGIALGGGYIAQTYGLLWASATVSGFVTGMYVVLTPIISWVLLRRSVDRKTWMAVLVATAGLALIGLHGWSIGIGELITLVCALFYAIHIVGLGEWSSQHDIYGFTFVQLATIAVICLVVSVPGGIAVPQNHEVWLAVGITAVLATALAFLVQTWTQSLVPPTRAAVVMTMEPVFAGIFGVSLGGNPLTVRILAGALCILAAMIIVQLKSVTTVPRVET